MLKLTSSTVMKLNINQNFLFHNDASATYLQSASIFWSQFVIVCLKMKMKLKIAPAIKSANFGMPHHHHYHHFIISFCPFAVFVSLYLFLFVYLFLSFFRLFCNVLNIFKKIYLNVSVVSLFV